MASKRLSPAANLLRNSKLFSLPPPLPLPRAENQGSQNEKFSETATLPHPIKQAIETSSQALPHGDWGMKRPLPSRVSRTSTPVIRVHEVDSIDHITEYDSAADHVLTLQKWQEMDIPIMVEQQQKSNPYLSDHNQPQRSVFEDKMHNTAEQPGEQRDSKSRWRFSGPWVLGMTAAEFEEFLSRNLRPRRDEFMALVRDHLRQKKAQTVRGNAIAQGEALDDTKSVELTKAEFQNGLKRMRRERHELWALIWKFLDIPGSPPSQSPSANSSFSETVDRYLAEADGGPPKTHPSAGLSYIRTNSHMYNHPQLGPQRDHPPVRSRVLAFGSHYSLTKPGMDIMGVAGVAAETKSAGGRSMDRGVRASDVRFNDSTVGGAKVFVQPLHAAIGADGRIKLETSRATEESRAVWDHYVTPGTAFFDEAHVAGSMAQANQNDINAAGAGGSGEPQRT